VPPSRQWPQCWLAVYCTNRSSPSSCGHGIGIGAGVGNIRTGAGVDRGLVPKETQTGHHTLERSNLQNARFEAASSSRPELVVFRIANRLLIYAAVTCRHNPDQLLKIPELKMMDANENEKR